MKIRRFLALFLTSLGLAGMLAGCGANSAAGEMPMEQAAPEAMMDNSSLTQNGSGDALKLPESRKWIVTVNMQAQTEDLDALLEGIREQIQALEGFVEHQDLYNGSGYDSYRYRRASLTVRIPADRVEDFTREVAVLSNVVSNSRELEDVTLQYVDTESRMQALKTEEARLLELLEQAGTMSDLLEIEARLTDVRYELESVGSRLRTYDNLVDYATIYLEIEEVREYTPVEEPTVWERISGGFMASLRGLGTGIVDVTVWILANLPYLLVWGGILWLLLFLDRKRRKKKAAKKAANPPVDGEKK